MWRAAFVVPDQKLHIVACDVGQGDGILIYLGQTQILVDGGPNGSIIGCLERHMPFWDRSIELVVLTHPQSDHYGGLINVFENYEVGTLLASEADSSTAGYGVLKEVVGSKGVLVVNPRGGMKMRLGLMSLDVVWPQQSVIARSECDVAISGDCFATARNDNSGVLGTVDYPGDLNDLSVVTHLRYGEFDVLLTGDIGPKVIDEIVASGRVGDVEYLKVPHHGSKNGLTQELLNAVTPEIAVISAGVKNRYGHPHREVIEMLRQAGIDVYRTDEEGDVEVVSDGESFWIQ